MKSKITSLVLSGLLLMSATSCIVGFTHQVTGNPVGTKQGVSKTNSFQFKEDYSIQTAAKNGGITKIATVEVKTSTFLGIIWQKTIVTGE